MTTILCGLIRGYQRLSAFVRQVQPPFFIVTTCKFYPSCSEYAQLAIQQAGPWRGSVIAARRICRCHPFAVGGIDYPKI